MENSNANAIAIAKKGQEVAQPTKFTGKITGIRLLEFKADELGVKRAPLFSIDIEGLPTLIRENGEKASILRTKKQMLRDLDMFGDRTEDAPTTRMTALLYAKGRPVTLNVSAHETGADIVLTEDSIAVINGEGKVGQKAKAKDAGFYVDGFFDIDFDKADIKEKRAESKANAIEEDYGDF